MKHKKLKDLTVLIAHEEEDILNHLKDYFLQHFKEVLTAFDGEDALSTYKNSGAEILISNANLEKIGGLELAVNIKSINGETKVVLLGSNEDYVGAESLLQQNIDAIFLQPFDLKKILKTIKALLEY